MRRHFGCLDHAFTLVHAPDWDEIVLTNSSILGPLHPLGPIFERMGAAPCDFWAMTESWNRLYHFQSYFFVFKKSALVSEAFSEFFGSILMYPDKRNIINSYELGTYAYLTHRGLRGLPAFRIRELKVSRKWDALLALRGALRILPRHYKPKHLNPTIHQALHLFEGGMPYLKIELLKQHAQRLWYAPLRRLIRNHPVAHTLSLDI